MGTAAMRDALAGCHLFNNARIFPIHGPVIVGATFR